MGDVIVGIDLGTTNSLVAVFDASGPRVLPDAAGRNLVPSAVRYEKGRVVVGMEARMHAAEAPGTTIASVKRLMGRSLADAAADLPYLSYRVVEGPHRTARIELPLADGARVVTPQEVSAEILRALKGQAEGALGVPVRKAVVTVPAYFDDAQRQATRDAGRIAGLEVVRIVNEPTAAALAYGLGVRGLGRDESRAIAVFDLGGGTFDISILRLTPREDESGTDFFEVLSTAGDTHLGGDDVDQMLVEMLLGEMGRTPEPRLVLSLRAAAERAKCELSEGELAVVRVEGFERTLTRAELEGLCAAWVERTMASCERALRDAAARLAGAHGPARQGLESVILVGGATRMPIVRRRVREFFGIEPYTAVDPDLTVALGAAVQAGIQAGTVRGALLLDVIPLSLGIETAGGAAAKVIFKNSTVPARATELFSTSVDGQTSIKVHVLQGEREMAVDCRSLGVFHLRGLPPMPAGIPQLEVEFLVDANGVLNVAAHERRSGRRAALQVVPNHGLTRDEVEQMESAALAHAREDMTRHRITDLVVNAKLDLKWIGERTAKYRDKLEPAYAADLEARIASLRAMVQGAERDWTSVTADALHRAKEDLDRASVRLQEIGIAESLKENG
jgi:molecular chaperone DnaK (HSP70)